MASERSRRSPADDVLDHRQAAPIQWQPRPGTSTHRHRSHARGDLRDSQLYAGPPRSRRADPLAFEHLGGDREELVSDTQSPRCQRQRRAFAVKISRPTSTRGSSRRHSARPSLAISAAAPSACTRRFSHFCCGRPGSKVPNPAPPSGPSLSSTSVPGSYLVISHPAGDIDVGRPAEATRRLNESGWRRRCCATGARVGQPVHRARSAAAPPGSGRRMATAVGAGSRQPRRAVSVRRTQAALTRLAPGDHRALLRPG